MPAMAIDRPMAALETIAFSDFGALGKADIRMVCLLTSMAWRRTLALIAIAPATENLGER